MHYPDHLIAAIYTSARQEIIDRIKLRDHIIAGYLAIASALLTAAFVENAAISILALPYVAFGAACLSCQHQEVIGAIGRYLATEFERDVRDLKSDSEGKSESTVSIVAITQWDRSRSFASLSASPFIRVRWVHLTFFVGPPVFSQLTTFNDTLSGNWLLIAAWIGGCILTMLSAVQVWSAVETRKSMWRESFRSSAARLTFPANECDICQNFKHFHDGSNR